jgi:hypothetical protein
MGNDGSLALAVLERAVFFTRSSSIVSWPTLRSSAAILASYSAMVLAAASSRSSSPLSYWFSQSWKSAASVSNSGPVIGPA